MPSLNEALAGVRGFGNGAFLGLQRYPAAGLMTLLDKAVGDGKLSYEQALSIIREQDANDVEQHMGYRMGGEVLGTLTNAVGTGGGGLAATAGRTAVQGAVSGFTANEGMDNALVDTAIGGAIGGTLGAVASGVSKAGTGIVKRAAQSRQAGYVAKAQEQMAKTSTGTTPLAQVLKEAGVTDGAEAAAHISRVANTTRKVPVINGVQVSKDAIAEAKILNQGAKAAQRLQTIATATPQELNAAARGPLRHEVKLAGQSLIETAKDVAPAAMAGGALGAGYDLTLSDDADPWKHAKMGAYAGGGLRLIQDKTNLAQKLGEAALPWVPVGAAETAARGLTNVGARATSQANQGLRVTSAPVDQSLTEPDQDIAPWAKFQPADQRPAFRPSSSQDVPTPSASTQSRASQKPRVQPDDERAPWER